MAKIKWTEKASSNLQTIHNYISKDSPIYATRFIKALVQATTKLETMPGCGRTVPELRTFGYREVIYQNYRIIYRLMEKDSAVEILSVVNARREIDNARNQDWELS